MAETTPDAVPSARALLKERDYLFFWGSRWCGAFAAQIESVALGWHMYALARRTMGVQESAFLVGMIGLAAFVPVFLLTLPAGEAADRYDRRKVALACLAGEMTTALVLTVSAWRGLATPALLLGVAVLFGASRAFFAPANTALGPMLVPRELLPRSIAWNSLAWQTASIAGPAAAGVLVALSPAHAFVTALILYAVSALCVTMIRGNTQPDTQPGSRWTLMKEGLAYVWREKIVFGAISLDLFAVLLGGATALLPVFARDVLHVGPEGFGVLRAGPAIGATVIAFWLAANPIRSRAGAYMFGGVAVFGGTAVLSMPFDIVMTFGWAALILWLIRVAASDAVRARLAAAGRMAFTNYLTTSIAMTTTFYGYGLGLFGSVGRAALYLFCFGMWTAMLLWSKPWLDRFHYGPFEWLWRSLSRAKLQPMRRRALA